MDWCSYFRLRDGGNFAQVQQQLNQEATAAGYIGYPVTNVQVSIQSSVQAVGFYHLTFPQEPAWLPFLGTITGQNHSTGQPGRGHSAIMLVEHSQHLYVLAFGTAHTIAKKLNIERRFGKTVVGNGKQQDEVRGIKAKVHGVAGKTRHERRGKGGPLGELEMPRRANMASGVAAKLQLMAIEHVANGDHSIRTIAPTSAADMVAILTQLEAWWNSGVETDATLAALDRVLDVRNQALVTQLDQQRLADIQANNPVPFSLCLDDEELWDATQVEYIVNRQRLAMAVLDEASVFNALRYLPPGVDPFAVRYVATVPTRQTPVSGRLAENLAYETMIPGQPDTFIYEDGAWFQAKAQWRHQVTQDVQRLMNQSAALLPSVTLLAAGSSREGEGAYITRQMASAPLNARCLAMHLNFPPNMRQIELCDICVDGNILLFMKRGSDRSACGDVTQQALDCANALVDSNPAFLNWANSELAVRGWQLDMANRSQLIFCVVLITANPARLPTSYTVRAMDALSMHLREIEKLGFRAALQVV